ncbi:hypothetical protein BJ322DRAFT_437624 [Thelephora terrestris]|uniref:Uncharacterized protein n=1 Tax=Thelephora terrestris TaxID=56493 RepID=A0A9P6LBY9_9AGAM|nr:hypothetical protein BJ322DRAFT_437624 [Thelephora terrestris]
MSPLPDSYSTKAKKHAVKMEPEEAEDSDEELYVAFPPYRRKRAENKSLASPVDLPPSSSSESSPHPEKLPYYTVVNTKRRPPGSGIRFAPNQRQIAKTPAVIYNQSRVRQPVAGPSYFTTRVGPPKPKLPERSAPKLRPAAEVPPPRPPPPHPGLAALEARMNAFVDENKRLRDELMTARGELTVTRNELSAALTRVDTVERGLYGLETLETKLEEMNGDYERLSNLLSSEHLFDSERFRSNIQAVVKNSFGYYWPSAKNDMREQVWKELLPKVKEFVEKKVGEVAGELAMVRSEMARLQQRPTTAGNVQNGDSVMAELKQGIERVEKTQEESEGSVSKVEMAQGSERTRRGSTPSISTSAQKPIGNVHPPHLPPKPPSPWLDIPQGPQRRGSR